MALRRRIGSTGLQSVSYLRRVLPPGLSPAAAESTELPRRVGNTVSPPPLPFSRPLADFFQFRSFAAPVQFLQGKQKLREAEDSKGPRINNAITAPFVRLVIDEGHCVVPRHEALQRAARLNVDLVEVDRKADPPVCKIMNFHKEQYIKEVKGKERLKTKSALALRGGESKEVQFKGKTELKDLKVKADAIIRLTERGYRVKCTAIASSPGAQEDLGGLLTRLLGLIEDACIVESGPHLDPRHVYVIVRNVKFATKKAGKKVSKAMEDAPKGGQDGTSEVPVATSGSGNETALQGKQAESDSESDNGDLSDHVGKKYVDLSSESSTQIVRSPRESMDMGIGERNQELRVVEMNRYSTVQGQQPRDSSKNSFQGRFPQDRRSGNEGPFPLGNNQGPYQPFNRPSPLQSNVKLNQGRLPQGPGSSENEGRFQLNNDQRPFERPPSLQSDMKFNQGFPLGNNQGPSQRFNGLSTLQSDVKLNQGRLPQGPRSSENEGRFQLNNDQRPFQRPPSLQSDMKFNQGRLPQGPRSSENEGRFPLNNNQTPFQQFKRSSPSPCDGKFAQKVPLNNQGRSGTLPGDSAAVPPTKSFGIFSNAKSATPSEPGNMRDAPTSDTANPGPKNFGIFSTSRSVSPSDKSATNNSLSAPKFGIFGFTDRNGSSDQSSSTGPGAGSPGSTSPPTPKFGIFDSKNGSSSNN